MEKGNLGRSLMFAQASLRERLAAAIVAAIAVAVAIGVAPLAHHPVPPSAGLVAILNAVLMLSAVVIAWMLAALYRISWYEPLAVLATVYGFAAVLIALYIVALPGAIGPHGAFVGSSTAASLWCVAHVGFILLMAVYVGAERVSERRGLTTKRARLLVRSMIACVLVPLCVAAVAVIVMKRPWAVAPDLTFTPPFSELVSPALALGYAVVIAGVVAVTRLSTTTSVWVTVVLVALECEVWTGGILAGRFYTAGWYAGCFEGFVAGCAFLNIIARMVGSALTELTRSNQILADKSVRDALTNLLNRRGFDDRLAGLSQDQRRRHVTVVTLLIVDVDSFKAINERFGHAGGDHVLREVATAISEACARSSDVCYRIGGDEFAVVLGSTDGLGAAVVAERIRKSVAAVRVWDKTPADGHAISASIGFASMDYVTQLDYAELYRRADAALFEAKRLGRNCVAAFDELAGVA